MKEYRYKQIYWYHEFHTKVDIDYKIQTKLLWFVDGLKPWLMTRPERPTLCWYETKQVSKNNLEGSFPLLQGY